MSLKAKVEAVVYAAEEPVTLAQLAGIFSREVLEELETAASQPYQGGSPQGTGDGIGEGVAEGAAAEELGREPLFAQVLPPESPASPESTDSEDRPPAAIEADEKKAARQRERQVRDALQQILNQLVADYAGGDRGMEIREIAGGYRMATKPEYHDAVRGLVKSLKPPMKLSLQALETLAVIAYKQPVTGPEISEIRGVDSAGVLGSLMSRKLIVTAGRKHVIGRPILYKTTKEFLLRFGLKDLDDLPSMEEFEKMAEELAGMDAADPAEDAVAGASEPRLREAADLSLRPAEGAPSAGSGSGEDLGEEDGDALPDSPAAANGDEEAQKAQQ